MYLVDESQFREHVDQLDSMPALPRLMARLNEMIDDPTIGVEQIAFEIGKDQILAVKILKLVNSAFYGFPSRISSLSHALVLLGFDVIQGLIISTTAFDYMKDRMIDLWSHSMGVSQTAGYIAAKISEPEPEEISLAGLLHDIGKVIFKIKIPEKYEKVIVAAQQTGVSTLAAEKQLFGFDHTQVALWICDKWSLPERLSIPLGYHHDLQHAPKYEKQTAIVALADILSCAAGLGPEGDQKIYNYDPEMLEILGLDEETVVDILQGMLSEYTLIKAEMEVT